MVHVYHALPFVLGISIVAPFGEGKPAGSPRARYRYRCKSVVADILPKGDKTHVGERKYIQGAGFCEELAQEVQI